MHPSLKTSGYLSEIFTIFILPLKVNYQENGSNQHLQQAGQEYQTKKANKINYGNIRLLILQSLIQQSNFQPVNPGSRPLK